MFQLFRRKHRMKSISGNSIESYITNYINQQCQVFFLPLCCLYTLMAYRDRSLECGSAVRRTKAFQSFILCFPFCKGPSYSFCFLCFCCLDRKQKEYEFVESMTSNPIIRCHDFSYLSGKSRLHVLFIAIVR